MAANIYQTGNQILDPKQYSEKDLSLIGEFPVPSQFNPEVDVVEYYIYDVNNRIISYTPQFVRFSIIGSETALGSSTNTISLNVEQDLTKRGYTKGTYQTLYNFFKNQLNSSFNSRFFIKEISPSRTEIRLATNNLSNSSLDVVVSDFINQRNSKEYFDDFFLNFGNNNQFVANNIILDTVDPNNYTVLIKLYNPLPLDFTINDTCWVCTEVADPQAFLVEFEEEEIQIDNRIFLQGPNFNIEIKDEISNATNYQTLNDLLNNTELTSSYNQLQNILEQKGVSINVDYTEFENFVHFSSADQRLRNFYYKVKLIEDINSEIGEIDSITSGYTSSSLATLQQTLTNTIKSFDGFENYMYYESTSFAWPKSNSTPPYALQSTSSAEVTTWYTTRLTSASLYDQENPDNLIYTIPEYLRDDPANAPYELFIEMMGQYFDQLYLYANDITNKYDADNRLDYGVSKDLVADVLKSFGIKLYENNFTSNDLYASLLGINASGSLLPPTGSEVIETYITASSQAIPLNNLNKETYKRIYHNMPYLLKKKGTIEGVRALISLFGIPDTILRVSEFGGKDKDNTNDWDYTQDVFNYSAFISGASTANDVISSSFNINSSWGNDVPESIVFRFKPAEIFPSSNIGSLVLHIKEEANPSFFYGLALEYSGSGYTSSSYSGSIPSSSNEYGTLYFLSSLENFITFSAPFYDGNWWGIQLSKTSGSGEQTYTLRAANKIYDGNDGYKIGYTASLSTSSNSTYIKRWNDSETLFLPCEGGFEAGLHTWLGNSKGITGSYQELRYYNEVLGETEFHDFVMNPHSIEGINYSSSAQNLVFRAPLGSELNTTTGDKVSIHPRVTGSNTTHSFASDSNYYVGSNVTFPSNTEFIYQDQPAVGIKNRISDKIKFISADTASGNVLTPYRSIIQYYPQSESYTRDVNYVEIAFSPQNEINDDINSSFGYFNIGEYIGDPSYVSESATSYSSLDKLRDTYFEKYYKNYNWTDYIRLIKYFDNSLFKMIKDFVPAKSSVSTGVVIKQHLLERNRQRPAQVESSQHDYSGSVKSNQYWNSTNEDTDVAFSLIETISGGSAFEKELTITDTAFTGSVYSTGSFSTGHNFTEGVYYNLLSGSTATGTGIFTMTTEGKIGINSDIPVDVFSRLPISFTIHQDFTLKNSGDIHKYIISSSFRGEISSVTIQPGMSGPVPDWINLKFPSVYFAYPEETFQIYLVPSTLEGSLTALDGNANKINISSQLAQSSSFSTGASGVVIPNTNYYGVVSQIDQEYEIESVGIGGTTTAVIDDARQLYNGEFDGTELVATDGNLSGLEYESAEILLSYPSASNNADPNQSAPYGYVGKNNIYFKIVNQLYNGSLLSTASAWLDAGRFDSIQLSGTGSYSWEGGSGVNAQIPQSVLTQIKQGDTLIMKIDGDFSGYDGASEVDKLFTFTVENQPKYSLRQLTPSQGADDLFIIPKERKAMYEWFKNLKAFYSGSHNTSFGQYISPSTSYNNQNFQISIIKPKQLVKSTNLPVGNNAQEIRTNTFLMDADYSGDILTPVNSIAIAQGLADKAPTPDSNYTITGIINSKYNGSKVTSPDFNKIS